jgi:hypothetical protein
MDLLPLRDLRVGGKYHPMAVNVQEQHGRGWVLFCGCLRKEILFQLAQGYAESGDLNRAVDLACELANLDFSYKDIGKLLDEWNSKLQKA